MAIKLESTLITATAKVPLKFNLQAHAAEAYAEFV